ncbi:peptidase [Cytobacillus purgationiresistens]|uniref:Peptidase n=1 Tax=Cytobacillus purgationiresistens TaxID=863449 RepID=A0ABU0AJK7_9BACI|nr:peptidase [Cytobacillus purgationiresistens]MDQ0270937.1 hypothetical protein [Cytobacillus purgationiresistens]
MNNISLNQIVINDNQVDYFFNTSEKIKKYVCREHLFFEFNDDLTEVPESILAIPFVANLAPLAWITNSTILVDQLDQSFFQCLKYIKKAYQNMYPNVPFNGEIIAKNIVENTYEVEHEAAQLFSGGLDALSTYVRIKNTKPILITEYAWHIDKVEKSGVWEGDKSHVMDFSAKQGLKNVLIQSNYGTFLNASVIDKDFQKKLGDSWWHGLHHGLAIITAAIPIAYKLKVKCIYIASSFFEGYKAKCASDPTVDNEIKFASGEVFHHGYDMNRQEKVKVIVNDSKNYNSKVNLRVCFRNEENCCECEKCVRTMVGILAEGQLPNDYGFKIQRNLSTHIKEFLELNVKFFNKDKIMQWELAKMRMEENQKNIISKDLLAWFLIYDFTLERKKALLTYRLTNFIPIIKRRMNEKINKFLIQNG